MLPDIEPTLKRTISLPMVTFYGIGTILGAGIYVLVGKVAGEAGMATPLAFLVASVLAGFSAFSYAELSSRYPRSAGEAIYLHHAFGIKQVSLVMGLLIVCIGLVSTATLVHGFAGYLKLFIEMPAMVSEFMIIAILGAIVAWGIGQSVIIASLLTILEIVGLLIIIWVSRDNLMLAPASINELLPVTDIGVWVGVIAGAFIAFYAFVGFEDIVNVAEEVVNPVKNVPRAVVLSLVVTTLFYLLVSSASVLTTSPEQLSQSDAPLAMIYEQQTGEPATIIGIISVLSVLNGALIQIVMASRILYGMSHQRWIPTFLGRVNPVTQTPMVATVLVSLVIMLLVWWLPILSLAKMTSFITLSVFSLINLSLVVIKLKKLEAAENVFQVPLLMPLLGFVVCGGFVCYQLFQLLG